MKLWQIAAKDLREVEKATLDNEARLEEWVLKDPSLLGIDILLVGRQVRTPSGGRIDLLGIDSDANLVVLELKRDKTPREIVAQALDYASWVRDLAYQEIDDLAHDFLKRPLKEVFLDRYGYPLPETVNISHSIIIIASGLDDSSERIVQYLSDQYKVPINAIFFTFFKSASGEFLGRSTQSAALRSRR
jgi:hypothetical protein